MCRHYHNVLEVSTRRKKRISSYGDITAPKKRKKPDTTMSGKISKRSRNDFFTCNNPIPRVQGRRQRSCRICGYAIIAKDKTFVNLSCCGKHAHAKCWETSTAKFFSKNRAVRKHCDMISDYLSRDRLTSRPYFSVATGGSQPPTGNRITSSPITASVPAAAVAQDQSAGNLVEPVPCKYCKRQISITEKQHLQSGCSELDKLYDPGGIELGAVGSITPLARRCAALSRLDASSGTPRLRRELPRK